jgi:hypothetical protein
MARRLARVLALATAVGCADLAPTRDVRVTIVDERSEPVPGALFYVEAVDDTGPFAYLWRIAGLAGEVPDSAREPLKLPWRRGARLTMVALAPGRRPAVVREDAGRVVADGAVLVLEPGEGWDPALADLAYPFDEHPDLAARLAEPSEEPLVRAFREAFRSRPAGGFTR